MSNVWFITGSSRGLGRAFTKAALEAGHRVVATARRPEELSDFISSYGDRVRAVKLDVTSPADVENAVAVATDAFGRIDVVINNAGYGFIGAFEEMSAEEFEGQINTNFFGVVNVTRAVLSLLRKQRSGHIFQITSIGGRSAFPGLSAYHASKFAIEGFSEALAQEIAPFGVKLTIVEPGGFRTDWSGASMAFAKRIEDYEPSIGAIKELVQNHTGNEPGDPQKAAAVVVKIAGEENPPLRLPLGNDAMAILRHGYKTASAELERWAQITNSTDFDGLTISDVDHVVLQNS
jgi:NAD(P)-dependent dehydrogenase (short-subunit alcohol dehydrogenase family)